MATILQYGILIAAVELLHMNPVPASCCGFAISAGFNYWLNYHLTFRSRKSHMAAATRFSLVALCSLALNAVLMALLVDRLDWPYLTAQVATTVPVVCWNFLVNRTWSFAAAPERPSLSEEHS